MEKVKGRDVEVLIKNLNEWLEDGRTISNISIHIDDSKAESHTLTFDEVPRKVKVIEKIVEKIVIKEVVNNQELVSKVENLDELAQVFGINKTALAHDAGYSSTKGLNELYLRSEATKRKRALELSYNLDIDFDIALKLVNRKYSYQKEETK